MPWYLRSTADRDTHRGELQPDGTVVAECGAVFPLYPLPYGRTALPGHPSDPDQICLKCYRRKVSHDKTASQ